MAQVVSIPFPIWETQGFVQIVIESIAQEAPKGSWFPRFFYPRRIEVRGEGLELKVKTWQTLGWYVNYTLRGIDGGFGVSWEVTSLKVRWNERMNLPSQKKEMTLDCDLGLFRKLEGWEKSLEYSEWAGASTEEKRGEVEEAKDRISSLIQNLWEKI
ncbi:MAG: hypothetical protein V1851_01090 [Patescibacteria group bacterium]